MISNDKIARSSSCDFLIEQEKVEKCIYNYIYLLKSQYGEQLHFVLSLTILSSGNLLNSSKILMEKA